MHPSPPNAPTQKASFFDISFLSRIITCISPKMTVTAMITIIIRQMFILGQIQIINSFAKVQKRTQFAKYLFEKSIILFTFSLLWY
jgi:hypothetical protein